MLTNQNLYKRRVTSKRLCIRTDEVKEFVRKKKTNSNNYSKTLSYFDSFITDNIITQAIAT
jgi:hypothetical protein